MVVAQLQLQQRLLGVCVPNSQYNLHSLYIHTKVVAQLQLQLQLRLLGVCVPNSQYNLHSLYIHTKVVAQLRLLLLFCQDSGIQRSMDSIHTTLDTTILAKEKQKPKLSHNLGMDIEAMEVILAIGAATAEKP